MDSELLDETLAALATHQSALLALLDGAPPPQMTTVIDKDDNYLNCNQSSYLRLAADCLTAAQGRPVSLWRDAFWLQTGGWRFSSLQVSPNPGDWVWPEGTRRTSVRLVFWTAVWSLVCVGLWTVLKVLHHWANTPA